MSFLNLQNIVWKTPRGRTVLDNVSVSVLESSRVGLVGPNGTGKSTLMQVMAGILKPTSGEITRRSSVWYQSQLISPLTGKIKVYDFLSQNSEEWWQTLVRAEEIFSWKVNADSWWHELSGGEQTKLKIGEAFASEADIVLLDEPTNHLDETSLARLQQAINNYSGAVVVASHYGDFLRQVTTEIWELSAGTISTYGGDFDYYQEQVAIQKQAQLRHYQDAQKQLMQTKKQQDKTERYAASRRRTTKRKIATGNHQQSGRCQGNLADWGAQTKAKRTRRYKRMITEKEGLIKQYTPQQEPKLFWLINDKAKKLHRLVTLKNYSLSVNSKILLKNVNLTIRFGDRFALRGDNGTGKSLLCKAIFTASHTSGNDEVVSSPHNAAYLDQNYQLLQSSLSIWDNIKGMNPQVEDETLRQQLGNFDFKTEYDIHQVVQSLSGGEKLRVALAVLSCQPLDLLILARVSEFVLTRSQEVTSQRCVNMAC